MWRIKFLLLVLLLFTASVFGTELERYSGQSEDDGQETTSGVVSVSFQYIEFMTVMRPPRLYGALRFPDITIPQGATINSAYLSMQSYGPPFLNPIDSIGCQDVDSATILEAGLYTYDISERWANVTTALVFWDEDGVGYQPTPRDSTPDLKTLVQEIVDRPGWKDRNAIMFLFKNLITGNDSCQYEICSWDTYGESYDPIFIVDYTPGSAVPDEDTLLLGSAYFLLNQNSPNPFNLRTSISYSLPMAGRIKLTTYDLLGRRVRTLVDTYQAPGHKSLDWDATDDEGDAVASGIYFYRLEVESVTGMTHMVHTTETKKMLLLK